MTLFWNYQFHLSSVIGTFGSNFSQTESPEAMPPQGLVFWGILERQTFETPSVAEDLGQAARA